MSATTPFALLANATSLPWAEIPAWPVEDFVRATAAELQRGARLCSWFGVPEGDAVCLCAVLAFDADNTLAVGRSRGIGFQPVSDGGHLACRDGSNADTPGWKPGLRNSQDGCSPSYPSLTAIHPQAHLFEREIWEQFGLIPEGHPWLKPVRRTNGNAPANDSFFRVDGPEIHEVAVGPVHAGIIEPGHFRFQCAGEEVLHLEIALGYQHRGIEQALMNGPHRATMVQMETIAGDTSIAHSSAYAMVMEALADSEAPLKAQWLRAIALELERLANHTGDIGALAGDVAFLPTQSACGKIRGDFLNLTAMICGNRFGRALVRPGGVRHDLDADRAAKLAERLSTALADTAQAATWFWDSASLRARFENVGVVSPKQAAEIGLVGPAARACGLVRDVRYDHPAGWHRFSQAPVAVWPGGDVFARARVRTLEIQRSGELLLEQLTNPPDGDLFEPLAPPAPDTLAVALVEGWRGEVCHVALTDSSGRFRQYKITDPSFHNWSGLALALRGTAISDFPICNKSFNLSYCGHDL